MGKKFSDVSNRQSKNERKKSNNQNKPIYTQKHVRAKEDFFKGTHNSINSNKQ